MIIRVPQCLFYLGKMVGDMFLRRPRDEINVGKKDRPLGNREKIEQPAVPPTPTGDPLLRALQQKGNLKTALESLAVDHGFDAEGNLLWLGLGSLAVTDEALAKLADEKKLHALYLYDTKITDAGLKHLAGLTGLRLLLLTATPVTVSGVAELEAVLPECVVVR
ncbi:MAG: hypothetical protein ABGY43_08155 [bacterium]